MARKYENGYLPKMEYWQGKFEEAKASHDFYGMKQAVEKYAYFAIRQAEVYGEGVHTLQQVGEFSPLVKKYFKNNYE